MQLQRQSNIRYVNCKMLLKSQYKKHSIEDWYDWTGEVDILNKQPLIIYGCGSIAKSLFRYLKDSFEVVSFTIDQEYLSQFDNSQFLFDEESNQLSVSKSDLAWHKNIPILPFELISKKFPPKQTKMLVAVGFVQMNQVRSDRIKAAKAMGYELINYIHPSVTLDDSVSLKDNIIILEYATIHPFSSIGRGSFISSNANIGDRCQIGDNCWINSGVGIAGGTNIGEKTFIGVNATIGNDIRVEKSTFIGANTFVGQNSNEGEVFLSPQAEKIRMNSAAFMKFSKM